MAEENMSQVKEMNTDQNCCSDDAKSMEIIDETMPLIDEEIQGDDDVLLPATLLSNGIKPVNLRRYSTGVLDKRGPGKAQVQTRYRGNQMSSTHDLCKHGKRREDDLVIKPWKLVTKKNLENGDSGKVDTLGVMRKSLGNVSKPETSLLQVAKREAAGSEIVKSCDGLRVKRSETKSTTTTSSDSAVKKTSLDVKKVSRIGENTSSSKEDILKNLKNKEKTKIDEPVRCEDALEKRVLRISENKSSPKEDILKNLKNKEKTKIDESARCEDVSEKKVSRITENKSSPKVGPLKNLKNKEKIDEPVKCEDVSEKTLHVVDSSIEEEKKNKKSIKSVKSEIKQSSEKKILRGSGKTSLLPPMSLSSEKVKEPCVTRADPRPIRQTTSRSKTGFSEKKETGSANLVTHPKTESKIRPKRIVLKVARPLPKPAMQLSFKKGKVFDPKPEDSTSTLIKFKKRVGQEPKLRPDANKKKKNLKEKREAVGKMNGEVKREKVVLRHRKVEAKKKLQTLFNNVIEETVSKLEEVRKSKVKALVGAFETVISLQDDNTKSSHKKKNIQSKSTSSQVVEG